MPSIYSYAYSETGADIWWGIQCSKETYFSFVSNMTVSTRCFVYIVNAKGESLAVAVDGYHTQETNIILAPEWMLEKLGCSFGDDVDIECIDEVIPKAETVILRPVTEQTTQSPIFVECLTEAFNKLGIIQLGSLTIQLDPSLPQYHVFIVESLTPSNMCFADGEVTFEFLPALDSQVTEPLPKPVEEPCDFNSLIPPVTSGFVPFSGQGRRLG